MNILKKLFAFYINSSIHVALAVTALTAISFLHLNLKPDFNLLFFVFFGTVTGYNFIKYAGIARLHHTSLAKNLKIIQLFSLTCFALLIFFALKLNVQVLLTAGFFGILTLFYALPFFGQRNLRTIGGIKIYIIALIWSGITVISPAVNAENSFDNLLWLELMQRFLFVLVLLVPFEIRDLKYDRAELKTLPQNMGVKGAKITGFIFLLLIVLLELLKGFSTMPSLGATVVISLLAGWVVWKAQEEQSPYFSAFWVEGLPILWLVLLLLLRFFS